jgi:hypothetical protein
MDMDREGILVIENQINQKVSLCSSVVSLLHAYNLCGHELKAHPYENLETKSK